MLKISHIIMTSPTRELLDQQLKQMSEEDPSFAPNFFFFSDYEIIFNQNLVQDVQCLISPYALRTAGPKFFFSDLIRSQLELNHDSGVFLWGIWPLEICGHKITIFYYAILPR